MVPSRVNALCTRHLTSDATQDLPVPVVRVGIPCFNFPEQIVVTLNGYGPNPCRTQEVERKRRIALPDSQDPACVPGYASLCDADASTLSSGFDIHKCYEVLLTSPHPPPRPPHSDCPASRVKHLAAIADNNPAHSWWGSVGESQVRATDIGSARAEVYRRRFLRPLSFMHP